MEALAPLGISALIFGGCCTNVYALEAILKRNSSSGLLITLLQFILVTLSAYPSQRPSYSTKANHGNKNLLLKQTNIPFHKLVIAASSFFAVNMLNNWAFAFRISVPVHIILRSFGSASTMAAGWLRGKRYSRVQVLSVLVLTAGVCISAWADALSKGKKLDTSDIQIGGARDFEIGLMILLVAQLLSAWMGAYIEDVYAEHGKHWDENLFYSHFLSLPMFLPFASSLRAQYAHLASSPPFALPTTLRSTFSPLDSPQMQDLLSRIPDSVVYLLINAVTQLVCITGVNLLGAKSSAVTVTIVLNVRKLVSFMLSVWLFGNPLTPLMTVGAVLVFGSGALYGWETTVRIKKRARRREKRGDGHASSRVAVMDANGEKTNKTEDK